VAESDLWPFIAVLAGALATHLWRALGVVLSGQIRADSPLIDLVGCIAYALLAALVARMILMPTGPLQDTTLVARLAATALGVGAFFLFRRSMLAGVATGGAALSVLVALSSL
jgi:branched-subunit amino acid transport protein